MKIRISKNYIRLHIVIQVFIFLMIFGVVTFFLDFEHLYNFLSLKEEITLDTVIFLCLALIQFLFIVQAFIKRSAEYYLLEEGIVKHKTGIFSFKLEIHKVDKVESIIVRQSFFQKLLNYGTIIMSSPLMEQQVLIENVSRPTSILSEIEKTVKSTAKPNEEDILSSKHLPRK